MTSAVPFFKTVEGMGGLFNEAEFILPLADAGSGAVETYLARGTGSATFTRATVKWTKLSSGLWASVASGTAASRYLGDTTAVGAYGGYFAEAAGTQLVTPTASIRDMTDASWVKTSITVAKNATGIDGVASSASTLTASGANGTIFQTLTAAASSRTYAAFVRRKTGTGTINITQNGGSTYTDVTSQINSTTYTRVSLNASVLNAAFGFQIVTSGDEIEVDFNQFEAGDKATSPMASAGAARNADSNLFPSAGNILNAAGTAYAEIAVMYSTTSTNPQAVIKLSNAGAGDGGSVITQGGGAPTTLTMNDGTTSQVLSGVTNFNNNIIKAAVSWGGTSKSMVATGATLASSAFDGTIFGTGSANMGIGCSSDSGEQLFGTMKNVRIWQRQLPDNSLQAMIA